MKIIKNRILLDKISKYITSLVQHIDRRQRSRIPKILSTKELCETRNCRICLKRLWENEAGIGPTSDSAVRPQDAEFPVSVCL
jgi:hypothetical protein